MKPYWRQNTDGKGWVAAPGLFSWGAGLVYVGSYSCYYDYENITGDYADPFIYYFYLMEFL